MRKVVLVTLVLLLGLVSAFAESSSKNQKAKEAPATPPSTEPVRFEQAEVSPRDLEIMRKIRERIDTDGAIAAGSRKILVHSLNGRVILTGPVSNEFEKSSVQHIAETYVGNTLVTDELTVE